jgi:hypothetical protein
VVVNHAAEKDEDVHNSQRFSLVVR